MESDNLFAGIRIADFGVVHLFKEYEAVAEERCVLSLFFPMAALFLLSPDHVLPLSTSARLMSMAGPAPDLGKVSEMIAAGEDCGESAAAEG